LATIDCQISLAQIYAKVESETGDRQDDDLKVIEEMPIIKAVRAFNP